MRAQAARDSALGSHVAPAAMTPASRYGANPEAIGPIAEAPPSARASPPAAVSTAVAFWPCSTRAAINPNTATDANRSGAPCPVETDAATQSARMPPTVAWIRRAVEPAGINPQSCGPTRSSWTAQIAPPASRAAPPNQSPAVQASVAKPPAIRAIPMARPRLPSARTITDAPAQAAKAAKTATTVTGGLALPTWSAGDREGKGDERRQPQQRATSGRGSLECAQVDE